MITIIAAVDNDLAIADRTGIPWQGKMPDDVAWFRQHTQDKIVILGGGLYKELKMPLPHRENWVLSRSARQRPGFRLFTELDPLIIEMQKQKTDIFISGGGSIYEQLMPLAQVLYMTHIDTVAAGPAAFFPEIDSKIWEKTWFKKTSADKHNAFNAEYAVYKRLEREI